MKDFYYIILYHFEKENVVTDTLSCKFMGNLAYIVDMRRSLIREIHRLEVDGVKFEIKEIGILLAHMELHSSLLDQIKFFQGKDPQICKIMREVQKEKASEFKVDDKNVL